MKKIIQSCVFLLMLYSIISCQKGHLDIKPDQSLLVPTKLSDMQQILDNTIKMNVASGLFNLSSDDFKINTSAALASLTVPERNAYLWQADIFEGTLNILDWNGCYEQVFYSNVVLDGLEKITQNEVNTKEWEAIKGSALFYRSMAFYMLVSQFAAVYEEATASNLPGIPLKISSDINEIPGRSTIQNVYNRIIEDLQTAYTLLPSVQDNKLTRPSKLAVSALLARIYLSTGNYKEAVAYAEEVILQKPMLLDFNVLSKTSNRPISFSRAAESEVIYWQWMANYRFGSSAVVSISPEIVSSYQLGDLRKIIYLRNRGADIFTFKGNYTGGSELFTGLSTSEMYLIRAECKARHQDIDGAMFDLNTLLKKRWDNTMRYEDLIAQNSEEALEIILNERQKEMVTRGQRWNDLKRLNLDINYAKTLKRTLDNVEYTLQANDKKYLFPIPDEEVRLTGIQQNDR